MPIRITGMNSGLDTESIISELVKAKSAKKDSLVKAQTKLQWKQDAWKELNTKVYNLYSKTLSKIGIGDDVIGAPNLDSLLSGAEFFFALGYGTGQDSDFPIAFFSNAEASNGEQHGNSQNHAQKFLHSEEPPFIFGKNVFPAEWNISPSD